MSKVEVHYMNNNPSLSDAEIAKDLDRPLALIEKNRVKSETVEAEKPQIKNQAYMNMVRPLDDQGNSKGIVFVTEASSQVTDDFYKEKHSKSKRYEGAIAKVFKD
jgi:hypothetical protein